MATVEQARDVEVDRALVEIRQRLQQMDVQPVELRRLIQEINAHPVAIKTLVRQANAQVGIAVSTAFLAGAAVATFLLTRFHFTIR